MPSFESCYLTLKARVSIKIMGSNEYLVNYHINNIKSSCVMNK